MRYVTVCFYHSQLLITVQGTCRCPCLSFRPYIKCCAVCSRFTFVCNLPSLRRTAPTLVSQSVWTKLHLHMLQLCRGCWQTAEMWLFAIPTWWVSRHSAQMSGESSPPCLSWDLLHCHRILGQAGVEMGIVLFVFVPGVRDQEISVRYQLCSL